MQTAPDLFEPPRVAVCVCTFRRPLVLDLLLQKMRSVVEEVGREAEVSLVVVDDSSEAEASGIVDRHRSTFGNRVTYAITGSRNISTARNKALEIGLETADLLAFIDDDCVPDSKWLQQLLEVQRRFDADIVTGYCRDTPPPGSPDWFLDEPWMVEPARRMDGDLLEIGPLKNSLFRASALIRSGIRFDEAFGRTGGEDALFFLHAASRSLRHVHAAEAVVEETGSLERVTEWFQFRRALWYGNTEARTLLAAKIQGRPRLVVSSLRRIVAGPSRALRRSLVGVTPQWRWSTAVTLTGIGRLLGVIGVQLLHSTIGRRRDGSMRRPFRAHMGTWRQTQPGMFSVVIPTLQQSAFLDQLVSYYCSSPLVREVIVINNASPTPYGFDHPKVKVLDPGTNIFVNPAWNMGVDAATSDYLIISNDDVLLPPGLVEAVASRLGPKVGIIGPHYSCFEEPRSRLRFFRAFDVQYAYGTLMFLERANYVRIPDELKIWYGDDWLFAHQRHANYGFRGVVINSPMSVTAGQARFDQVKDDDRKVYREHLSASPYRERTRLERGIRRRIGRLNK